MSKKRTKVFPPRLFEKMLVSGSRSFGGGGDLHVSSLNSQYLFILKLNLTVLKTQKLKLFLPLILRRFFAFIVIFLSWNKQLINWKHDWTFITPRGIETDVNPSKKDLTTIDSIQQVYQMLKKWLKKLKTRISIV